MGGCVAPAYKNCGTRFDSSESIGKSEACARRNSARYSACCREVSADMGETAENTAGP